MATNVSASWSSGSLGDKHTATCVGVAGKGLPSAYYYCTGTFELRLNADGTIDVRCPSFVCKQTEISNIGADGLFAEDWTFHGLYVNRTSFTLYDSPSGPSGYGSGVKVISNGTITHNRNQPAGSHDSWLTGATSTGWHRVANNIDQLSHNADWSQVYLYCAGLIDYNATPTDSISIAAARVTLTKPSQDAPWVDDWIDYYPWERMISGEFYSLNRDGGPSQQTATGLFRKVSGVYRPVGNTDSGDDDHGFRYNNGWKKSPKSGKGA